MKQAFIVLSCLLSVALLQAETLSNRGCGGKKKYRHEKQFDQAFYLSGCGCGGGGAGGSNEIPPDEGK
jgi:hypothetical protein